MPHLQRRRRALTLPGLIAATIVISVPASLGVSAVVGAVHSEQAAADATSALAIVDAAYYTAQSDFGQAHSSYTLPVTASETTNFIPAGSSLTSSDLAPFLFSDSIRAILFSFPDGNTVCASAPQAPGSASPVILGVSSAA